MKRRITRQLQLGSVFIGGDAPVSVQSMTNTRTDDAAATLKQIKELAAVGCDVIRCAVPDMPAAQALREIVAQSQIPVIADIHFDYKLALAAIDAGVNGLRLNPGNIGGREKVEAVVAAARIKNIPIRIGVNAGSLPKDLLEKYGHPTAEALVEAAWRHIHILEELDYRNIKISLKAHDVPLTIAAYRLLAAQCDYPLHVGITEAGTVNSGIIKSAVGIGTLLAEGIGDTIRVSLTGDPVNEVKVAYNILKALGLREYGPTLISCPTCGRTRINLEPRIVHHPAACHLYLPVIIRTAYCDHFPADPRRSHSSRSRTMISCSHHHYQAVIPGSIYPFYQGGIFRHFPSGKGSYRNIYDPYAIFFPVFPDPPKSH